MVFSMMLVTQALFPVTHTITQSGFSFSPSTLTVNVGDVVRWVWTEGEHTTTSKTIPVGAQLWNSPLNSSNTSFEYTVTVAGTYNYKCTPHETMGMVGSFTAIGATEVNSERITDFKLFPNPFNDKITINSINKINSVEIYDITGKLNSRLTFDDFFESSSRVVDLSTLHSGVYIAIINGDKKKGAYKLVKK